MKKIVLILVISCISLIGYSQFQLGLKGAVSMSSLSTDLEDYENAFKTGFQAGAYFRIGKKLHLQPEVYFAGKSGDLTYDIKAEGPALTVNEKVTLSTVDVPVLLGLTIIDPKVVKLRLQAGPVASFVVNKDFDVTLNGISEEPGDTYKDAWNDMNWALQFGAGVDVLFLTIDLRYELGLSNMYSKPEEGFGNLDKVNNNLFFLSVGFRIFKI
jgi:hypothetical protein